MSAASTKVIGSVNKVRCALVVLLDQMTLLIFRAPELWLQGGRSIQSPCAKSADAGAAVIPRIGEPPGVEPQIGFED
jgi:hypothetical protein